jgi:hypothetical protein
VQHATEINFFRTHFVSHTGNLAVGDFQRVFGTKQVIPWDVWTDMVGLGDGLTN